MHLSTRRLRQRPDRRRARAAVAAAAAAALTTVAGALSIPSAQASPAGEGPARHCVANSAGEQKCFRSFTEAIDSASGGRIDDAPSSARAATHDAGLRAATEQLAASPKAQAAGDVITGTFFHDQDFGGASLTVTSSGMCEKDGYVDYQHDFADDWKDRISSVQPWGNCSLWLYPEPNLGGDRDGPFDENTADIGTLMNDRAQSVGFS